MLTHGPEELLIQFKGHERAGQVTEPLFENAGNDVDVVVVQAHTAHIWNREVCPGEATFIRASLFVSRRRRSSQSHLCPAPGGVL